MDGSERQNCHPNCAVGHLRVVSASKEQRAGVGPRRGSWLYLRTGCVLNSEAALISPSPLPLRAASRTAYVVSGFRPTMVTMPSMLAVGRTWEVLQRGVSQWEDGRYVGDIHT